MPSAESTVVEGQLRRARAALEEGLRAAGEGRAEVLLAAYPALAGDAEAALELVYTEFAVREDLGQNPDPAEWYERFPQWRADLEQMFEVHRELKREDARRRSRSTAPFLTPPPTGQGNARTVGEFEILGELGRGGMGVVYKARQPSLGRVVAVKVILSGAHAGSRERERFRREAETAARLDHPNIVRIFAVGEHDGRPYCAMEFVDGTPLADLLTGEPWPLRKAAELVAAVASAAHHAHQNGVVHRDLKPANVLLTAGPNPSPVPKIVDFGLAKCLLDTDPGPTRTGDIIGTPTYMAPEQADGVSAQIGPPTDVWAMGVTLYELLVGHPPFQGESSVETLQQVRAGEPVPLRRLRPSLPRDLEVVCLKCLRKKPADRYPTAQALADDLNRYLRGETVRARPVRPTGHVVRWCRRNPAVASLLVVVALFLVAGPIVFASLWLDARAARSAEADAGRKKDDALADKDAALTDKDDAIERLEHDRYSAQLVQAQAELDAGTVENAHHILGATRQQDRNLEWDLLNRLSEFYVHRRPFGANMLADVSPDGGLVAWVEEGKASGVQEEAALSWHDLPKPTDPAPPKPTEHRVQVRRLPSHDLVREWTFTAGRVTGVSFADHGRRLLVTADDPAFQVFDAQTGELQHHLPKVGAATRVIHPPAADVVLPFYLASLSADGTAVHFWDTKTGAKLEPYLLPKGFTVTGFVPSPDQTAFCVSGRHSTTRQNFRYTGKVGDKGPTTQPPIRSLLAYDPTGKFAVIRNESEDLLSVVEVAGGKVLHTLRTDSPMNERVILARGGRYVACIADGKVAVWDLTDPAVSQQRRYLKPTRLFAPVQVNRRGLTIAHARLTDAGELAVVGWQGQTLTVFAVVGGGHRDLAPEPYSRTNVPDVVPLPTAWFHPDGKRLFAAGPCGFDLWDTTTGKSLFADRDPDTDLYGSVLSPDGSRFVVLRQQWGTKDQPARQRGVVEVWSVDGPKKLWERRTPGLMVLNAGFRPDGRLTLVAYKGAVTTHHPDTGEVQSTAKYADFFDASTALTPDAAGVLWMKADKDSGGTRVCVTDATSGDTLRQFVIPQHPDRVGPARFADADRLVVNSWATDHLQLWDVTAGRWRRTYTGMTGTGPFTLTGDRRRILALGSEHVTGWDFDTGRKVFTLPAPPPAWRPRGIAVTPDGARVAVVALDGRVRVWDTGRAER